MTLEPVLLHDVNLFFPGDTQTEQGKIKQYFDTFLGCNQNHFYKFIGEFQPILTKLEDGSVSYSGKDLNEIIDTFFTVKKSCLM